MFRSVLVATLLGSFACANAGSPAIEFSQPDSSDSTYRVADLEVGEGVRELEVTAVPNGVSEPSAEQLADATWVFQVNVGPGQRIAAVVRAQSPGVRPFVVIRDHDGAIDVATGRQAMTPQLDDDAAIAVVGSELAQSLIVMVTGGEYMETSGTLALDIVDLAVGAPLESSEPSLTALALTDELRERHGELEVAKSNGFTNEQDTGLLERAFGVPLEERAAVTELVESVNEIRPQLFDELGSSWVVSPATVGEACAHLWASLPPL